MTIEVGQLYRTDKAMYPSKGKALEPERLGSTLDVAANLDPSIGKFLARFLNSTFFSARYQTIRETLRRNRNSSRAEVVSALIPYLFENGGYFFMADYPGTRQVILTPQETSIVYGAPELSETLRGKEHAEPDCLVFRPAGDRTRLTGLLEFTTLTSDVQNKKAAQIRAYESGEAVSDLTAGFGDGWMKSLGRKLNEWYPQLPANLAFDINMYRAEICCVRNSTIPRVPNLNHVTFTKLPFTSFDIEGLANGLIDDISQEFK